MSLLIWFDTFGPGVPPCSHNLAVSALFVASYVVIVFGFIKDHLLHSSNCLWTWTKEKLPFSLIVFTLVGISQLGILYFGILYFFVINRFNTLVFSPCTRTSPYHPPISPQQWCSHAPASPDLIFYHCTAIGNVTKDAPASPGIRIIWYSTTAIGNDQKIEMIFFHVLWTDIFYFNPTRLPEAAWISGRSTFIWPWRTNYSPSGPQQPSSIRMWAPNLQFNWP